MVVAITVAPASPPAVFRFLLGCCGAGEAGETRELKRRSKIDNGCIEGASLGISRTWRWKRIAGHVLARAGVRGTVLWVWIARSRRRLLFGLCGLLRNGREVTGQNLASTHCFVVFNGACTMRADARMAKLPSIGRARIRSPVSTYACSLVRWLSFRSSTVRLVFISSILEGLPSLSASLPPPTPPRRSPFTPFLFPLPLHPLPFRFMQRERTKGVLLLRRTETYQ